MFPPNASRGVVTLSWRVLAGAVAGATDNPPRTKTVSSIEVNWRILVAIAEDLRSLGYSFVAAIDRMSAGRLGHFARKLTRGCHAE